MSSLMMVPFITRTFNVFSRPFNAFCIEHIKLTTCTSASRFAAYSGSSVSHHDENGNSYHENQNTFILQEEISTEVVPHDSVANSSYKAQDVLRPVRALSAVKDFEFLSTVAPPLQKSFNLAPYVDKSEVLQQLVKLGVDLSVIERKGTKISKPLLTLNFDKDVKPRIMFLINNGVPTSEVGLIITRNPLIFQQSIEHLETRIRYLTMKGFNKSAITRIILRAPCWLNFYTKAIDSRLGYFQKEFKLSGNEVRFLIARSPKLGILPINYFMDSSFLIREEMGFSEEEVKTLLLTSPKLWLLNSKALSERFQYVHQEIGISHKSIVEFPGILNCRKHILQQRHEYLGKLGRAQYDRSKPNYVSLQALCSGKDEDFCWSVAKTTVADYNLFLKSF